MLRSPPDNSRLSAHEWPFLCRAIAKPTQAGEENRPSKKVGAAWINLIPRTSDQATLTAPLQRSTQANRIPTGKLYKDILQAKSTNAAAGRSWRTLRRPSPQIRSLLIHDALAFLSLLAVSIILFAVTFFLFRSFQAQRAQLATSLAEQGRAALAAGHADEAARDLRTALSYRQDGLGAQADQEFLAEALAQSGHTDEATDYFLNLWETRPGDGFLNLQLARLARKKRESGEATNYYRAAIFGSWEGDGIARRREVRFELADFLLQQHSNAEARNELETIARNAGEDAGVLKKVARMLTAAGYPEDALALSTLSNEGGGRPDAHSRH